MIRVMKARPRLRYKGTCTQLNKALRKLFTQREIEEVIEYGVDTEDEYYYRWHLTYKRQDFVLVYEKKTGEIIFGKDEDNKYSRQGRK